MKVSPASIFVSPKGALSHTRPHCLSDPQALPGVEGRKSGETVWPFHQLVQESSHKDCRLIVQVLYRIFTYNILTTSNRNSLTDDTTHLINSIFNSQRIDLSSIICYMMIQAHESTHSIHSLPFSMLVTHIMQVVKVPFKVA